MIYGPNTETDRSRYTNWLQSGLLIGAMLILLAISIWALVHTEDMNWFEANSFNCEGGGCPDDYFQASFSRGCYNVVDKSLGIKDAFCTDTCSIYPMRVQQRGETPVLPGRQRCGYLATATIMFSLGAVASLLLPIISIILVGVAVWLDLANSGSSALGGPPNPKSIRRLELVRSGSLGAGLWNRISYTGTHMITTRDNFGTPRSVRARVVFDAGALMLWNLMYGALAFIAGICTSVGVGMANYWPQYQTFPMGPGSGARLAALVPTFQFIALVLLILRQCALRSQGTISRLRPLRSRA